MNNHKRADYDDGDVSDFTARKDTMKNSMKTCRVSEVRIDFASGDTLFGREIVKCRLCGQKGVRGRIVSENVYTVEHVVVWTTRFDGSEFVLVDGCYRGGSVSSTKEEMGL